MKINLAVLFGGQSTEHEVSCMSAASILRNIDEKKYNIIKIGISKQGKWYEYTGEISKIENYKWLEEDKKLVPDAQNILFHKKVDVVFPVLHGLFGEDGTIQGLCRLTKIPCVGPEVLSSSLCMDKVYTKYVLENFGILQADYVVVHKNDFKDREEAKCKDIIEKLEFPIFIKPANSGSSVGITKAHNNMELIKGMKEAFKFDRKVIVEKTVNAREVEVAVLGNHSPQASVPGEIVPIKEFYDYEAKYESEGSKLIIPAELSKEKLESIRTLALEVYSHLDCKGMARVDFLVDKDSGEVYLNEVNTIPGFTKISMYPKLWEASGIDYNKLIDKLIELALESNNSN